MGRYILTRGSMTLADGKVVEVGGVVDLTDEQAARRKKMIKPVEAEGTPSAAVGTDGSANTGKISLSGSAQDIKIAVLGSNSVEELEALKAEEVAEANRAAILKAIDARVAKLKK